MQPIVPPSFVDANTPLRALAATPIDPSMSVSLALRDPHDLDRDSESPDDGLLSHFPFENTTSIHRKDAQEEMPPPAPKPPRTAAAAAEAQAQAHQSGSSSGSGSGGSGSQSHSSCEATQPDVFDTQMDVDDEHNTEEEEAERERERLREEEARKHTPWARLINKDKNMPHFELMHLPVAANNNSTDNKGRVNVYSIGRGPQNSIRIEYSARISNAHCVVFCQQNLADPARPFLEAFVEDLSANGTFVNDTRLVKNVPRQLRTGDVLCLVNPKLVSTPAANISQQDVDKCSFVVTLDLPNPWARMHTKSRTQNGKSKSKSDEVTETQPALGRSATVIRLLTQRRSLFDFYELRELLGQGGAASVYLGVKKDTGAQWAIKIIDVRHLHLTGESLDSLTREAEMLRALRHPHIIHLEDVFCDDQRLYLVLELSRGGDLFERILQKKQYTEQEAKETMRNILKAIAYMHSFQIAHRDLKPENILLSSKESDTEVKISDLGLAKVHNEQSRLKTYCGTPQYFAPEVLQRRDTVNGEGSYTLQADMWSIGVMLYVLIAGAFPFDDPTRQRRQNHHHSSQHTHPAAMMRHSFTAAVWRTVSGEVKDLIDKLLVQDPAQRLTAEQALQHVWFTGNPINSNNSNSTNITINININNNNNNNNTATNAVEVAVSSSSSCFSAMDVETQMSVSTADDKQQHCGSDEGSNGDDRNNNNTNSSDGSNPINTDNASNAAPATPVKRGAKHAAISSPPPAGTTTGTKRTRAAMRQQADQEREMHTEEVTKEPTTATKRTRRTVTTATTPATERVTRRRSANK